MQARVPRSDESALPPRERDLSGFCEGYDENGVDLTLIDEMLCLTPRERLLVHEGNMAALIELMSRAGHPPP